MWKGSVSNRKAASRRSTRIAVQPPRSTAALVDDEDSMDIDVETVETNGHNEDDYESDEAASRRRKGGRRGGDPLTASKSDGKKQRKKASANELSALLPHSEMLQNCLLYLFLMQHKKVPVKKSEVIKFAMNGQTREFERVFKDIETVLNHVFGMKVIGIGDTQKSGLFANYIIVSNYNLSVCDMVTPRDHEVDCRRSILFLILTVIFMLNRSIDEELIWKVMSDTKLHTLVCEKKENLRRFLKQEYVSTMYLSVEEENKESDHPVFRYSWGCRADKEFSKYSILKFVTKQFPGKKPIDFTIQFGIAKETEGELVAADAAIEEREAEEGVENIPPVVGSLLEEDEDLLSHSLRPGNAASDDEGLPQIQGDTPETDEMDSD